MAEWSLRRLLIMEANSVIIKRHNHAAARQGTWLGGMLSRKPPMLVRVALAKIPLTHASMCCELRMAHIVWALMACCGVYQFPAEAA
ncbi:hypothetical protein NBRC116599_41940 [Aquicoccus sp. SU-CL01552]